MSQIERDAAVFKALSDPLRLRLLHMLPGPGDKRTSCVCDLAERLGVSQPCLSHHLNILKGAGLVDFEKDGCSTFYFVDEAEIVGRLQDFKERIRQ